MSVTLIPNQLVKFITGSYVGHNNLDECNCYAKQFAQLVNAEDTTQFEVRLTQETGADEVLDGQFLTGIPWDFTDPAWTYDGVGFKADCAGTGTLLQIPPNSNLVIGSYYRVTFTLTNYVAGSVRVDLGTNGLTERTANGRYIEWGFMRTTINLGIVGTAFTGSIEDIEIVEYSTVGYRVLDLATPIGAFPWFQVVYEDFTTSTANVPHTLPGGTIKYFEDWALILFPWQTILDLGGLEGCYDICLYEVGQNLVDNHAFVDPAAGPWAFTGGFVYDAPNDEADHPPGVAGTVSQAGVFVANNDYRVEFLVRNYVAGTLTDGNITPFPQGSPLIASTANGVFVGAGIANIPTLLYSCNAGFNGSVTNITARDVRPVACSEPFELGDWDCTKLLTWSNVESGNLHNNAFAFNYLGFAALGFFFTHSLRVIAKLWRSDYDKVDKTVFTNSIGGKSVLNVNVFKKRVLSIEELPEYIHDAIAIGIDHDIFRIDAVLYVNEEDEYSPNWRNSALLAPADVEVKESGQDLQNSLCT